jgi:hypothetical protein
MLNKRLLLLVLMALVAVLGSPLTQAAWADSDNDDHGREMTIAGFADVPASTLQLPLAAGASPVIINATFGIPSVTIAVQVTTATRVKSEFGLPVTLIDGDRIQVDMRVVGNLLRADKIVVEAFPELELIGTAKNVPDGVTLPLAAGKTVDFLISLGASGVDVPVRLTANTKIKGHIVAIHNGDTLRLEAAVRDNKIVVTEINRSPSGP